MQLQLTSRPATSSVGFSLIGVRRGAVKSQFLVRQAPASPCSLQSLPVLRATGRFILIIVLLAPILAFSQEDRDLQLYKKLYAWLSGNVASEGMLVLAAPAVILDPWLDESKISNRKVLADVLDYVIQPSWLYKSKNARVSTMVEKSLEESDWPELALSKLDRQKLVSDKALLYSDAAATVPKEDFKKYLDLSAAFENVKKLYDSVPAEQRSETLITQYQQAKEDLDLQGQASIFAPASAEYQRLTSFKPREWHTAMQTQFAANQESVDGVSKFPNIKLAAKANALWDSLDWRKIAFDELAVNIDESKILGLVDSPVLWKWGADASAVEGSARSGATNIKVEMEIATFNIERPWLDPLFLTSAAWRWKVPSHDPISDGGDMSHGVMPRGIMPAFATTVVFARNIHIRGNWPEAERQRFLLMMKTRKNIGWGPFLLGGTCLSSENGLYFAASPLNDGFRIPEIEIIAYGIRLLPKCPNSNPEYWQP